MNGAAAVLADYEVVLRDFMHGVSSTGVGEWESPEPPGRLSAQQWLHLVDTALQVLVATPPPSGPGGEERSRDELGLRLTAAVAVMRQAKEARDRAWCSPKAAGEWHAIGNRMDPAAAFSRTPYRASRGRGLHRGRVGAAPGCRDPSSVSCLVAPAIARCKPSSREARTKRHRLGTSSACFGPPRRTAWFGSSRRRASRERCATHRAVGADLRPTRTAPQCRPPSGCSPGSGTSTPCRCAR